MLDTALREMIACLERTARSHLIRDMGAFHAALFDREGRFVAGRPCSTTIAPILMNWPPEEIRDGDVFLWNDVFLAEGGPGQMANICVSTPVYHRDILVAFSLICCRHDDMAGMAPGGVPAGATDILQEGLRIPPIKYYERGIINETARRILFQNTRKSQSLQAGWSAQIASCRIGASRVKDLFGRFGEERVIGHFDEILDKCEKKVSELFLSKIPDGAHRWEDFIESDGVNRRKRHALRINMTKKSGKLTLDFRGTSPQASGPINWQANSDGGIFLRKWLGAILLHLAEDPGQISEIEFNQGICRLIDISLPPPGTLITPGLLAPTGMSAFTLYRLQSLFLGVLGLATGGKMPADQDRLHCWGFHGKEISEKFFLFQEILAGGGGGSPLRDGEDAYRRSHHFSSLGGLLSSEVIESQFPLRLERQGISMDSGGPGMCRGGLGQFKEYRILKDVEVFHLSGRAKIPPWGVNRGQPGGLCAIVINPGSPVESEIPAFSNRVPVREGDLIRVNTAGGGGWGVPYEREEERVREDVCSGKVSADGAMRQYGVVVSEEEEHSIDKSATVALRQLMRGMQGKGSFFERGGGAGAAPSRRPRRTLKPKKVDYEKPNWTQIK